MASKFDFGDRICVSEKDDLNWLGVVINPQTHKAILDSGKTVTFDPNTAFKVEYWKEVIKPFRNRQAMEKFTTYLPNLRLFKARKSVTLSQPMLKSMWWWLNFHAFDNHLQPITLKIIKAKSPLGKYILDAEGPRILVTSYMTTMAEIFSTVAHEMVHQLNFEYDLPKHIYTREDIAPNGNHGIGFLKEAKKVSEKIGVEIDVVKDDSGIKIDGITNDQAGVDYSEAETGRNYAFLLMQSEDGFIYGIYLNRQSHLGPAKQELATYVRMRAFNKRIYGGISNFELPKKYLTKYSPTDLNKRYRSMPKDVFNLLKSKYKPLDTVEGPDKMKV